MVGAERVIDLGVYAGPVGILVRIGAQVLVRSGTVVERLVVAVVSPRKGFTLRNFTATGSKRFCGIRLFGNGVREYDPFGSCTSESGS